MVSGCVRKRVVIVPQIMLQQLLGFHIQVSGNGMRLLVASVAMAGRPKQKALHMEAERMHSILLH